MIKSQYFIKSTFHDCWTYLFSHAEETASNDKPNFIFFIADDVSQMDFGCYGHPTIKTPHIDALQLTVCVLIMPT